MANLLQFKPMRPFLALVALLIVSGCDAPDSETRANGVPYESTRCENKQAQIGVMDGIFQIFCGCTEPGGTVANASIPSTTPLQCTIPAGTTVFFHFVVPKLKHQILSVSAPNFTSSIIYDPKTMGYPYVHAITLDQPGTYNFLDGFQQDLTGRLIVN